jgi:H+/Cl- antiporter ClcA
VFGSGYDPTKMSLENSVALPWYFGVAKFFATLLSATCGIAAGIFAPSLSVGAGLGDNIAALLPNIADHSAIVLLVMAAYLSGVTRAPVTSFIISMEMTNSHQMLLPLMVASVVASQISKLFCPEPLYHKLSEKFTEPPVGYVKRTPVSLSSMVADVDAAHVKYSSEVKKQAQNEDSKNSAD